MGRVLVTGGTGFLGRHLVRRLVEAGREVRVLARPGSDTSGLPDVELCAGDVTRPADLERALDGVTRVFHAAAEVRDGQPAEVYDATNRRAVAALLDLCRDRGVERLVHTSSYFAIGRTGEPRMPATQVADEYWTHDPGDMHDAHEQSKYDAEHELNQHVSRSEPVLALVPTMIYGPELRDVSGPDGLRPANRITRMLVDHAHGRYPGLPGDGSQLWNLVHVEDVARGHVLAMEADDGSGSWPPPGWKHWHYILGGENVPLARLFELFAELTGVAPPKPARRKGGLLGRLLGGGGDPRSPERYAMDSHSWAYSSEFAREDFGYESRPLAQGLGETVAWLRAHGCLTAR